jgi:hypothetical protein
VPGKLDNAWQHRTEWHRHPDAVADLQCRRHRGHNGKKYVAQWWTCNNEPGPSYGPLESRRLTMLGAVTRTGDTESGTAPAPPRTRSVPVWP